MPLWKHLTSVYAALLMAVVGAALSSASMAQVTSKAAAFATIGVVHLGHKTEAPVVIGLRQGLKGLGYVEGKDFVLDIRASGGSYSAAVKAAEELVKTRARILVSAGTLATKATKEGGGHLPVVFTQVGEPVGAGFVKSLQRPGSSMTGFSHLLVDTTGKRLELLKELVSSCRIVLVIFDPTNPTSRKSIGVAQEAARKLGVTLQERHVSNQDDVMKVLDQTNRRTADAILVISDSLVTNLGDEIIKMSHRERVPIMFHEETWVQRGGLASYGASFIELGRQAATYVDKILKGAKPADLPVQQATKFDLVINIKAAKALNLAMPQSVLLRADKVIE